MASPTEVKDLISESFGDTLPGSIFSETGPDLTAKSVEELRAIFTAHALREYKQLRKLVHGGHLTPNQDVDFPYLPDFH